MKVALTGGFYKAKSLLAGAQRCLNLYPEANEKGSPFPYTYYPTPGLVSLARAIVDGQVRGLYVASNGELYTAIGSRIYLVSNTWALTTIGTLTTTGGPVSMSDNRLVMLVVDGSTTGYFVDLATTRAAVKITAAAFYGADKVDYVDTFFVLNRPGTNQWYISASELSADLIRGGAILTGTIVPGAGYANGVHAAVGLNGGSGTGAIADITVAGGAVTVVALTSAGAPYAVGDVLTANAADLDGAIALGGISAPGSAYANGVYANVPLTGGSGTGAHANITVAGGIVTVVTFVNVGQGYLVGDILGASSASLGGGGAGFSWTVSALAAPGAGFTFTVSSINAGSSGFLGLDIASKSGAPDNLATLAVLKGEVWLLGTKTGEVWFTSGAADFPFQRMPGVFIEHGCAAKGSVAKTDLALFWLGQDKDGARIVLQGSGYEALRISTHAIEAVFQTYSTVSDAVGLVYQQEGHSFYQLTFPTADATWVYDLATKLWHERAWIDDNGSEHRHRANCHAYFNGKNVVGDWQTGQIYALDPYTYTDDGQPITRRRGFPHMTNNGDRLFYRRLVIEMEVGTARGPGEESDSEEDVGILDFSDPNQSGFISV